MSGIYLSLIIPCYNEGPTFAHSVGQIVSVIKKLKKTWEIIFVEDKSTDSTKDEIVRMVKKIKNSRVIYHNKNQGRGRSVTDGILASKAQICGFLDVDLEVSAEYIPIFISEIEKGADAAVGKRFYEKTSSSILRFIASKIYAFIVKSLLDLPISDTEAGYKFFRRTTILPVLARTHDKKWFWDTEICARAHWANLKISQIPVLFERRNEKKSTVRLIPDTLEYMRRIINFRSQMPKGVKSSV